MTSTRKDLPPEASAIEGFLRLTFANDPQITLPEPGSARFGSKGLRIGGKVFAMEWQEMLAVKLSSERVLSLVAAGAGHPLHMGNRKMKEWLVTEDPSAWLALAQEARDFAVKQTA